MCGSLPACAAGAAWSLVGCRKRNGASSPPPPAPSLTLGQSVKEPPLSRLCHHDPKAGLGARHGAEEGAALAATRASRRPRAVHLFVPPRGVPAVLHIVTVVRQTGTVTAAQQLGAARWSPTSTCRRPMGRGTRAGAVATAHQLGAAGWLATSTTRRQLGRGAGTGAVAAAQELGAASISAPTTSRRQLRRGARTGTVAAARQLGAASISAPTPSLRQLGRGTRAGTVVTAQQLGAAG